MATLVGNERTFQDYWKIEHDKALRVYEQFGWDMETDDYEGFDGRELENQFVPWCTDVPFDEEKLFDYESVQYLPFNMALLDAKRRQPSGWDPTEPPLERARNLHAYVAMGLKLRDYSKLKLYTTRGTATDTKHGGDAVFEYHGRSVRLDFTTDPTKPQADENESRIVIFADETTTDRRINDRYVSEIVKRLRPKAEHSVHQAMINPEPAGENAPAVAMVA